MNLVVIPLVALFASALTFFSGFGLGTLLLPAFALFYPVEQAVALTAAVHLLNNLFKLGLIGRRAAWRAVFAFGLPATLAAFAGAWLLIRLADLEPLASYSLGGRRIEILPAKFAVGLLLLGFTGAELTPGLGSRTFGPRWLPVGGLLSGFFGGVSGMQGALRSAFLLRAGLSKEAFIATGVVVACLVDSSRLGVYLPSLLEHRERLDFGVLLAAVLAAFAGAALGNHYLKTLSLGALHRVVGAMIILVALSLVAGIV